MSVLNSDDSKRAANCPKCGDITVSVSRKVKRKEHGIEQLVVEDSEHNKELPRYCPICGGSLTLFFSAETMACHRKHLSEPYAVTFDRIMAKQQKELDEKMNESS